MAAPAEAWAVDEPIELYRRRGERSYRPVAWMLLVAALELVPAVLLSSRPPARDGRELEIVGCVGGSIRALCMCVCGSCNLAPD
jgi:hypothetical protein